jgi:hypothetical protein
MEEGVRRYFYDTSGKKILADIDETSLRAIADKTRGRYFNASSNTLLEDIFRELHTTISSPIRYTQTRKDISLAPYISIMIAICM